MTHPENAYDHLIPEVCDTESTVRLQLLMGQLLPVEMHKLLINVIAQAEKIGEKRGRGQRGSDEHCCDQSIFLRGRVCGSDEDGDC